MAEGLRGKLMSRQSTTFQGKLNIVPLHFVFTISDLMRHLPYNFDYDVGLK